MRTRLSYGKTGLDINLLNDWDVTIVEPRYIPGFPNPQKAITDALRSPLNAPPLREQVKATDRSGLFSQISPALHPTLY